MPIGEPRLPRPDRLRPGRTTDLPAHHPGRAPVTAIAQTIERKRREGSNRSIHPGAAAGRGRPGAQPSNGAPFASAAGPTETIRLQPTRPRRQKPPQPLAAAQSACRATRPPRFSRQQPRRNPDSITAANPLAVVAAACSADLRRDTETSAGGQGAEGEEGGFLAEQGRSRLAVPARLAIAGHALTRINPGPSPDEA